MEVIRGRERDRRQEIRGQARRGGTRSAQRVETRTPIPAKPGRKTRHDYEYKRNGVANLFMVFAPLEGWRNVEVTDRHTAIDYAHTLRNLSDVHFPDAAKIVLVQDNLNIHKPASLYEASPLPRRAGSSSASNGITRPSTAAGSTWLNPNLACSRRNVWNAASPTSKSSPAKSPHGRTTATSTTPRPTGNSKPPTPASS